MEVASELDATLATDALRGDQTAHDSNANGTANGARDQVKVLSESAAMHKPDQQNAQDQQTELETDENTSQNQQQQQQLRSQSGDGGLSAAVKHAARSSKHKSGSDSAHNPADLAIAASASASSTSSSVMAQKRFQFYQPSEYGASANLNGFANANGTSRNKPAGTRFNFYNAEEISAEVCKQREQQRDQQRHHTNPQHVLKERRRAEQAKTPPQADLPPKQKLSRPQAQVIPAMSDNGPSHSGDSHTDEILRSLQETEDQRNQILSPAAYTNNNNNNATTTNNSIARRITPSKTTKSLSSATPSPLRKQQQQRVEKPSTENDARQRNNPAVKSTGSDASNQYEDALKAAIQLLKQHRRQTEEPPAPAPAMQITLTKSQSNDKDDASASTSDSWLRRSRNRPRTPREADRVLQSRLDDDDDDANNDDSQQSKEGASQPVSPDSSNPDANIIIIDAESAAYATAQRDESNEDIQTTLNASKSKDPTGLHVAETLVSSQPAPSCDASAEAEDIIIQHPDVVSATSPSIVDPVSTTTETARTRSREQEEQTMRERKERMAEYTSTLNAFKSNNDSKRTTTTTSSPNDAAADHQAPVPKDDSENDEQTTTSQSRRTPQEENALQKSVEKILEVLLEREQACSVDGTAVNDSERLLNAMDELLRTTESRDEKNKLSTSSSISATPSVSTKHTSFPNKRQKDKPPSVVEELLAEEDDDDDVAHDRVTSRDVRDHIITAADSSPSGLTDLQVHAEKGAGSWVSDEKKVAERDLRTESSHDATNTNYSDMIESALQGGSSATPIDEHQCGSANGGDASTIRNLNVTGYPNDQDDAADNGQQQQSTPGRVLGPLSQNAGGTTGVVLESSTPENLRHGKQQLKASSDAIREAEEMIASMGNADISGRSSRSGSGENFVARPTLDHDDFEERMEQYGDTEALELMRTLCAHLLPFGVDGQSNQLLEAIPAWDEDDANEAGYRIIRLSRSQLMRVERAFEWMINEFQINSEKRLNGLEGSDVDFEKELLEAEKLLDDAERRNGARPRTKSRSSSAGDSTDVADIPAVESLDSSFQSSHPDFPGVKTAGKGEMGDLEYFHLPIIFKSHVTGFEPTKDLVLEPGNVIAGQYLIEGELGSAAFSTAYRCTNLNADNSKNAGHKEVCLKVIKNTKDFFDQSLDEIKILELLRQTGKCQDCHVVEMKSFFYHREHLVIVTELLRQNLFEFGKFILDNDEEPYFTIPRLAYITRQCLIALKFVHSLGLVHSDVKPENILLSSYSRAEVKLIDFGSSCYLTDRQSSYIQSRSYRAPEVILGLPYDGKIDVWSLGCVVAEMFTGDVTFQNDSIVSMLSRIEAICGPFPRHMIAQGSQSGRFFTKSGLLYENVSDPDQQHGGGNPLDDSTMTEDPDNQFDIFQPKNTCLSSRLGFSAELMGNPLPARSHLGLRRLFADFVGQLLTIDPDGRPTAGEALTHPWMLYAATLTDDDIKYPSSS